MNYVFLIAFLCPFFSPIPFSTLYSPSTVASLSWEQLWFIDLAWILATCHKRYTYKAQFNIKSIAKQATPSACCYTWKTAQLSCKFCQHFRAALVCPKRGATKSAFISICARHCPTLVFALFAPPLLMLCGCLGSDRGGWGGGAWSFCCCQFVWTANCKTPIEI